MKIADLDQSHATEAPGRKARCIYCQGQCDASEPRPNAMGWFHRDECPARAKEDSMAPKLYRIFSSAGVDYGTWEGRNQAEALCANHAAAGYTLTVKGGSIVWPDDETRELCGDVEDWLFVEQ